jgi:hypothetical protein
MYYSVKIRLVWQKYALITSILPYFQEIRRNKACGNGDGGIKFPFSGRNALARNAQRVKKYFFPKWERGYVSACGPALTLKRTYFIFLKIFGII